MTADTGSPANGARDAAKRRLSKSLSALKGEGPAEPADAAPDGTSGEPAEIGGPDGPDPTRYGDWEHKGRCIDF